MRAALLCRFLIPRVWCNLQLYDPVTNARLKRGNTCGGTESTTALQVDLPCMKRTYHGCARNNSLGQRSALMRAAIINRQKLVPEIENCNLPSAHLDHSSFANGNIFACSSANPHLVFFHPASLSIDSIFTNCVGCRGASPSSHASRDAAFDLRKRSRSPCCIASGA